MASAAVRSKAVILLLSIHCCCSHLGMDWVLCWVLVLWCGLWMRELVGLICVHHQLRSYGDGSQLNVSSDRLEKPRIEPATPDLQGEWSTQYTTFAPWLLYFNFDVAV